jgi:hypothetical protein
MAIADCANGSSAASPKACCIAEVPVLMMHCDARETVTGVQGQLEVRIEAL